MAVIPITNQRKENMTLRCPVCIHYIPIERLGRLTICPHCAREILPEETLPGQVCVMPVTKRPLDWTGVILAALSLASFIGLGFLLVLFLSALHSLINLFLE